jgi:hypothetical protein
MILEYEAPAKNRVNHAKPRRILSKRAPIVPYLLGAAHNIVVV